MNRERKYGTTFAVVGVLALPFFVGIPLLGAGLLLLAGGECLRVERWIRVLLCLVAAALLVAVTFLLAFPPDGGVSAEASIGRSVLFGAPVFLAILVSVGMAALTAARFPRLSRTYRALGLGPAGLCAVGAGVALLILFRWQTLGAAGVALGVWACIVWRKRSRERPVRRSLPRVAAEAPAVCPVISVPLAPVASPAKPLRSARPVCGFLALALAVLALPIGLLVVHGLAAVMDTSGFRGMGAGVAILGFGILAVIAMLFVAMACAIASLRRRERYPALPWMLLTLLALPVAAAAALYVPLLMVDALGGTASLAVLLTGIGIPTAVLIRRNRRRRNVTGGG